jgi:hypothetical protein
LLELRPGFASATLRTVNAVAPVSYPDPNFSLQNVSSRSRYTVAVGGKPFPFGPSIDDMVQEAILLAAAQPATGGEGSTQLRKLPAGAAAVAALPVLTRCV